MPRRSRFPGSSLRAAPPTASLRRRRIRRASNVHARVFAGRAKPKRASEAPSSVPALAHAQWPASVCAALVGAAVGLLIHGASATLGAVDEVRGQASSVAAGCLLALAVGVRIPRRFVVWAGGLAWRSLGRAPILIRPRGGDRSFYWLVVSVLALAAGLCTALSPMTVRCGQWMQAVLREQFLWGPLTGEWMVTITTAASILPSFVTLGMALAGLHHLSCRVGPWDAKATAWALIGASCVGIVFGSAEQSSRNPNLPLIGASLPALLVALTAGLLASAQGEGDGEASPREAVGVPEFSDRWPTLLRASLVAIGGGTACAVAVWSGERVTHNGISWLILAAAVGLLVGGSIEVARLNSIGAFGVVCCVCAVMVGAGAPWVAHPAAGAGWVRLLVACGGAWAIGFATGQGRRTLLLRVASPQAAGAQVLGRLLVCSAVTLVVTAPISIQLFGARATLVLLALSMIAVGGMLAIYDPSPAPGDRRRRLAAVFGALAVMLVLTASSSVAGDRGSPPVRPSPTSIP